MGTGCSTGQAVGTAAAMAVRQGSLPADVTARSGGVAAQMLRDDAYLPGVRQDLSALTLQAVSKHSPETGNPCATAFNRPSGTTRTVGWPRRSLACLPFSRDAHAGGAKSRLILSDRLDRIV